MTQDEQKPKTALYPRDASLDPQLVWKGKDQQDQQDLAVPAVPIYIQEKIHPQAIVEDFRRSAKREQPDQPDLFADFNGLSDFTKTVDFYHHRQHWSNRMILGDSLLVMTSLAEKEGLKGKVQSIYFDPPYGIKFGSNWQVSTRKRDVKDGRAEDATRQPEQVRAFAEQWGRRWITIDTSRVSIALARTRVMCARFPFYLLADSPEGVKKEAELSAKMPPPHKTDGDIRKGFVYQRVPHVTLKSIANNPDIAEGMSRRQIDAAIGPPGNAVGSLGAHRQRVRLGD